MNPDPTMKIHHYLPGSRANGPGNRLVIWVQGCTLACDGCYNPATHPTSGGMTLAVSALTELALQNRNEIEGVTISGGEPFQQSAALLTLVKSLRQIPTLSILIFSGFELDEIKRIPGGDEILDNIDVLIYGRYQKEQRLAQDLRGSSNKTVLFLTQRYGPSNLTNSPISEILISPTGQIEITGINPILW